MSDEMIERLIRERDEAVSLIVRLSDAISDLLDLADELAPHA